MVDPENQTTYTCKVQDGGETPLVSAYFFRLQEIKYPCKQKKIIDKQNISLLFEQQMHQTMKCLHGHLQELGL